MDRETKKEYLQVIFRRLTIISWPSFAITPCPEKAAGGFRIGAMIEKDGKRHHMIRADVIADEQDAIGASLRKARQMIDEQGDRLF